MTENHLVSLIARQWSGDLTEEEADELREWGKDNKENQLFLERVTNEEFLENELERWANIDAIDAYRKSRSHEHARKNARIRRITGWSVAAALLLAVAIIGVSRKANREIQPTAFVSKPILPVMPGRSTATLTLSNGQVVLLDSVNNGDLAIQGGARLVKIDSSISYIASKQKGGEAVAFNALTTPKSGQYRLTLPDGSRIWLNNVSSLKYPTSFVGKNRTVELTGEGYFEIARDATKPFYVKVRDQMVEVLGTSFNIMAYEEEGNIQTTLLTGSVRVQAGGHTVKLDSDEQVELKDDSLKVTKNVPSADIVSWKDGFFYFGKASFATVMRQLARWYDVNVIYKGKAPDMEFGGKIDRGLPLNELLKFLDKNQIHFRLEGRDLIVLPS